MTLERWGSLRQSMVFNHSNHFFDVGDWLPPNNEGLVIWERF